MGGCRCWFLVVPAGQTRRHARGGVFLTFLLDLLSRVPRVGSRPCGSGQRSSQILAQPAERFAAVADGCFPVAGFGQRLLVGRIEKYRVVAETAVAFRLMGDAAFDGAPRLEQNAAI